ECAVAELSRTPCATEATDAVVRQARAELRAVVERSCTPAQARDLGFIDAGDLLAAAVEACRQSERWAIPALPSGEGIDVLGARQRQCARAAIRVSARLGRFAVRSWRYAFESI